MKKIITLLLFLTVAPLFAQNIQLHYDLGEDRDYFTTTVEMFKPDEYGATFFFIDFDYNNAGNNSISLAYFEIARYIAIPGVDGLSATIQYNDGTAPWGPLGHIVLGGASYPIKLGDFITINVDVLARKDYLSERNLDGQLTLVWFKPFLDGKLIFSGFADFWTTETFGESKTVFLSEPQLWYNIDKHLAVGGEVELSKNFLPTEDFEVKPTLALKWNF
ncbi:MAG: DUF5020 family protein [Melioribacteraceae bacterium]|nr:DUF5020 family protein [Melioribacteraceae bacterium]